MGDIGKLVAASVITAIIIGGVGYVLVVREIQVNISHIQEQLAKLEEIGTKNGDGLVVTKLFIAGAHPERDATTLASVAKLQGFNPSEIEVLASSLADIELARGADSAIIEIRYAPPAMYDLIEKYQLSGEDLATFASVGNVTGSDGTM